MKHGKYLLLLLIVILSFFYSCNSNAIFGTPSKYQEIYIMVGSTIISVGDEYDFGTINPDTTLDVIFIIGNSGSLELTLNSSL